ncbi:MAG: ATP-binding protein [Thermodesulfobacteriota bacterium]
MNDVGAHTPVRNRSIGRKFILYILLFSTVVTALGTFLQLHVDYARDIDSIYQTFRQIRSSHLESITKSLWVTDEELLKTQLQGLLRLPNIAYVAIEVDGRPIHSLGTKPSADIITRGFPLSQTFRRESIPLGTLRIVASLSGIHDRLMDRILIILATQSINTFLVSIFIFFLFYILIGKHLVHMAAWAKTMDVDHFTKPFAIRRARKNDDAPDELDQLANAFNIMQANLNNSFNALTQANIDLRNSEERIKAIFKSADNVSFIVTDAGDPDPTVLEFSPGAETIFGYRRDEMVGRTVSVLHIPEDVARFPEIHRKMREGAQGFSGETVLVRKSGETFPALFSTYPLLAENGTMYAALGVSFDISERKKLESQLRQSHKMESIGRLAGGIAHDFNNILGIILGNTELAIDDLPDWSPTRKFLQEIKTAVMRAKDVVRQILSFSRKTEQNRLPTDLVRIVKETLSLLKASIPKNIFFVLDAPDDIPPVVADPTQIHQVLINLCTNSAHAMEERGGKLEISLRKVDTAEALAPQYPELKPGKYVRISIADTGAGIHPEVLEKIFDPYFTTKETGKGSGMGLAVVHGIVKNHEGHISVSSKLGEGAVFEILLPSVEAAPDQLDENEIELPRGNESILLVDDEESIVDISMKAIGHLGYRIRTVTDPCEALRMFSERPRSFDLVITDMLMPGMNGLQLTAELLAIRSDLPIILCTGFSEKVDASTAARFGVTQYLDKPITQRELAMAIRKALDHTHGKNRLDPSHNDQDWQP